MIVEFKAIAARKVWGTDVKINDTLYAVRHDGLYFVWCYTDKASAEKIDKKAYPESDMDISANWRRTLKELVATSTKVK